MKSRIQKRALTILLGLIVLVLLVVGIRNYHWIWGSNTRIDGDGTAWLYVTSGSVYSDVFSGLNKGGFLKDSASFDWLARKKHYLSHVHAGRYRITAGMSNNRLINMLRSGEQDPVRLTFNNIRTKGRLAGVVSVQIEADSAGICRLLEDGDFLATLGLTPETAIGIFLPNTYELYWNTSAEDFIRRMKKEYDRFWNKDRQAQAESIGLSPMEVMTLASIVDEETTKTDEEARIAGVYMNRLNKGMRLHADPTIKFAVGDMSLRRVLNEHLEVDSPYNTYKHGGLPPGPIRVPSLSAIDAVLNYEHNDYLYFCVRDDFSGYHVFARTLLQHNKNARSYHNALNRRKIFN